MIDNNSVMKTALFTAESEPEMDLNDGTTFVTEKLFGIKCGLLSEQTGVVTNPIAKKSLFIIRKGIDPRRECNKRRGTQRINGFF